jgi:hypothetical protein
MVSAQFIKFSQEKSVAVHIFHSPQFELNVRRVAFGKPGGGCIAEATELIDRMILPDFQQNQIDVVERQALDQIMAEHNFNQSTYADSGSAAQLGKILGPSALIIVNVNSCRSEQIPLYNDRQNYLNNSVVRTLISKTRYSLEGSLRIVDLTTGKILGSHNFEAKPEKTNEAQNGQPEYPPVDEVKDGAMEAVKFQVHSMFFPYGTQEKAIFYDDKDCDLKEVYELYKNGDHDGAVHMMDRNLEQCKTAGKKEKALARAYYDAGLLHCLNKDYDAAADLFKHAMDSKGAEAVATTSSNCQQARAGSTQLKAFRDRMDQLPVPAPINVAAAPEPMRQTQAPNPPPSRNQPDGRDATSVSSTAGTPSVEERLKKLDSLFKRGLINKKDYDEKKAEILKDL